MKHVAIIVTGLLAAACSAEAPSRHADPKPVALSSNESGDFSLAYEISEPERELKAAYTTNIDADAGGDLGEVSSYTVDRRGRVLEATPRDPELEPADAPADVRWGEPIV